MRAGERLRLAATGGRSDVLRIVCTAFGAAGAALILLVVAVVASMPQSMDNRAYRLQLLNDPGLRPGVIVTLVLLALPVLAFTGVSSRLGSPARDRRLASLRLAGASPADVRAIAALETGLSALAGSALGGIVFLLLRWVLDRPRSYGLPIVDGQIVTDDGRRFPVDQLAREWPTDVWPHPLLALLALLLVPVVGTLFALVALRRVALTPFGVVKDQTVRTPKIVPALAIGVGSVGAAFVPSLLNGLAIRTPATYVIGLWGFSALAVLGLVVFSASLAALAGRALAARAQGPAGLIAGRRLMAHPFDASKVTGSIILGVVAGGAAAASRANALTVPWVSSQEFFAQSYTAIYVVVALGIVVACLGLLVLQAEALVSRRRALAGLVASGTPLAVLVKATLVEVLAPLVPVLVLGALVAASTARSFTGGGLVGDGEGHYITVPFPWLDLGVLVGGTVLLVVLTTLLSLVTLRATTRPEELRTAA